MKKTWKIRSILAFLCAALLLVSCGNLSVSVAKAEGGVKHLNVIFTIDVEDNRGNVPNLIEGDLSAYGIEENCGLDYIISTFQKYGVRAVFFVNIYEHSFYDKNYMPSVLHRLQDAGMEIGLHAHTPSNLALDFFTESISKYDRNGMKIILAYGRDYIKEITGFDPISFRSGSYAMNDELLLALYETGFSIDSSLYYGHENNSFTQYKDLHNQVMRLDEILEFPVVNVFDGIRWRKLDIDSLSENDIVQTLKILKDSEQFNTVQIMFHSFTFMDLEEMGDGEDYLLKDGKNKIYGENGGNKEKFENLLTFLTESDDYDVITFQDYLSAGIEEPPYDDNNLIILNVPDFANVSVSISGEQQVTVSTYGYKEGMEYAWYLINKDDKEDAYKNGYSADSSCTFTLNDDANGEYRIKVYERDAEDNRKSAFAIHTIYVVDGKPVEIRY